MTSRKAEIERILELQMELDRMGCFPRKARGSRSRLRDGAKRASQKIVLYAILGKALTRSLGDLIQAVRQGKRPYLGEEMARTLDAVSRKIMGYKRWLLVLGLLAALPGMVSVYLLWQQSSVVARIKENTLADLSNGERVILLGTIYNTYEKTPAGMLTTPIASAPNRRNAVLRLIERDEALLARVEEVDLRGWNHMVDLSIAPLNAVDFSALPGEPAVRFEGVSFVNTNFEDARFEGCSFDRVWFSSAYLWNTNFRNATFVAVAFDGASIIGADFSGAQFLECDFTGARFDETTKWPEGVDPLELGAVPFAEEP